MKSHCLSLHAGTVVWAIDLVCEVDSFLPHFVSSPCQGRSACLYDVVRFLEAVVTCLHSVGVLTSVILMMRFHVMWVVVVRVVREILHAMMICFEQLQLLA